MTSRIVVLFVLLAACRSAPLASSSRAPVAPSATSGSVSTISGSLASASGNPVASLVPEAEEAPFVFGPLAPPPHAIRIASDVVVSPANGAPDDSFGWSVAIARDGSRAIVSNHHEANATGSARVFTRNGTGWLEEARLVPRGARPDHAVAWSVALSADGDRAILGAYGDGRAHVFARTGNAWREEATLSVADVASECEVRVALLPDGTPVTARGESECALTVAIDAAGSRAIVGSHRSVSTGGVATGLARVFVRDGSSWREEASLVHSDAGPGSRVGWSVAISADGRYALVGSCRGTSDSVRVFVRGEGGWSEEATLRSNLVGPNGDPVSFTATKLALDDDGTRAVIGARLADDGRGAALVFVRSATGWTEEAILREPNGTPMAQFGAAVAVDANASLVFVGGPMHGHGLGVTRLYLRHGSAWTDAAGTEGATLLTAAGYGASVAIAGDGSVALVGAYADDVDAGENAGSVHVLSLASTP